MKVLQLYREGRGQEATQMLSQYMVGYIKMNGKEVYREAPRAMAECVDALCRHADLDPNDLGHIVPHQANSRMTRRLGELLIHDYAWPASTMGKLVDNFRPYGNLSNASIGMALTESISRQTLHDGEWMALPAVGGGMNYGCWLLRYHIPQKLLISVPNTHKSQRTGTPDAASLDQIMKNYPGMRAFFAEN